MTMPPDDPDETTAEAGKSPSAPTIYDEPPRRGRALRVALLSLAAAMVSATLATVVAAALWNTQAGTRWLLAHLPGLTVVDVRGSMGSGDVSVGSLRALESGVQVDIDTLHVQGLGLAFRPLPGVWLGVRMADWDAASVRISARPSGTSSGPARPPSTLRSPVTLAVERVHVAALVIGTAPPLQDVSARLELGADGGRSHRVDDLRLAWERIAATGRLRVDTDTPMGVTASLSARDLPAPPGAPAQTLPHWSAQASVAGPLQALGVDAHLRGEDSTGAGPQVDLQARITPFEPLLLSSVTATTRDLDLAVLAPWAPATKLSGRIVLATSRPAVVDIDMRNDVPKAWSAGGLPLSRITARVSAPWNGEALDMPSLQVALADERAPAGEIRAQGHWAAGRAQLQVDMADVQPGRLDQRLGAFRVSGPLRIDATAVPAPNSLWAGSGTPVAPHADDPLDRQAASMPAAASRAGLVSNHAASGHQPPVSAPAMTSGRASSGPIGSAPTANEAAGAWSAHLSGRLNGLLPALQAGPRAPSPPPLALTLDAQASANALELTSATVQAGAASLSAKGSLHRAAGGGWSGSARAQWAQWDPGQWIRMAASGPLHDGPNRLDGSLELAVQDAPVPWRGLSALRARAEITLAASRLAGLPLEGHALLTAGASPWSLAADMHSGSNTARLDATLAPESAESALLAGLRHVHLAADLPAIAEFRPLSPQRWPNAGQARFELTADGAGPAWQALAAGTPAPTSGPTLALSTEGQATGWTGDGVRLDSLQWSVRLPGAADAAVDAALTLHEARWGAAGVTSASARLTGTAADHTLRVEAQAPVSPPEWLAGLAGLGNAHSTRVEATLQGGWKHAGPDTPEWQGRLGRLVVQAATPGQASPPPWVEVEPIELSASRDAAGRWRTLRMGAGTVQVAGLALAWQPSFWTLPAAEGEAARWSLDASLAPFHAAPLVARAQPSMGWHGDLLLGAKLHAAFDGRWHVQAELARSGGDLSAASDVALPGTAPLSLGLGALYARLNAEDGRWNLDAVAVGDRLGELVAHARVTAASPAALPDGASALEADLRARVADLNVWGAWLPPGWRVGGRLRTDFTATGRLAAPRLAGDVVAHQLVLRNALQGVYAHDGEVDVRLDGDRATIRTFRLTGGTGTLTADGDATLAAAPVAHVHLEARQFQVLGRLDRRIVTSGDARVTLTGDSLQVQGRLGIDEGLIDIGKGGAPTLDADVDVVGPTATDAAGAEGPATAASAPEPPSAAARATTLDLALDLGDKLHLKGRGIDTFLRGAVQVSAPGGRPAVRGTIHTQGGHYTAYGQNLDVTRGDVFFSGAVDNPRLDVLATRPNLDVVVGVAITGTAQSPHVRLVSEPEMSDAEKLSWLMLGRAPEGLGQADTALLQQAAIALLAGENEAPSDQLVRRLGLTDFSLRQQEDENNVRQTVVSLGRQLSRRWYLGYERGVNETTGNWQLIYRIAQRLTVRAQSGLDNSLDVIYTWRWN